MFGSQASKGSCKGDAEMNVVEYYKQTLGIKTDRNGYGESIMWKEPDKCWFCNTPFNLDRHELFRGPDRKKSKLFGLWIRVCREHHNMAHRKKYADELHVLGQIEFEKHWKLDFMEVFGRSYL